MTTELTTATMIGIGGRTGEAEMVLFANKSEMLNHMHAHEHHMSTTILHTILCL